MKRPDNSVNRNGCRQFNRRVNDKPRLGYSDSLGRYFKRHPPRPMVEPMHQGHWSTVDDYVDVGELADE